MDECTGPSVAKWLRGQGHDVFSVYAEIRGASDNKIIQQAHSEDRILITADKDFGEKVYREQHAHKGIILLRLADERPVAKIETLRRLLDRHSEQLGNQFVVVTETNVRFAQV